MNFVTVIRLITVSGILWTLGSLAYLYSGGTRLSLYTPFVGLLLIACGASQTKRVRDILKK